MIDLVVMEVCELVIVEDDEIFVWMLKCLFEWCGYVVRLVVSYEDLVVLLVDWMLYYVVVDLKLGGVLGLVCV